MILERLPENAPLRFKRLAISLPKRAEQPRRPLDISEEKRDCARRKVASHGGEILRVTGSECHSGHKTL